MLPPDTPLQSGQRYPMLLRANPRGHKFGIIDPDMGAVLLPRYAISERVSTVAFRSKDPSQADQAAYDRRVAVQREEISGPGGVPLYAFSPVDPDVKFEVLARHMDGPYVDLDDFYFQGVVDDAYSAELGDHKAMFAETDPEAPAAPPLRTVIELGYRGPYFDNGSQRAPWALVASEDFEGTIGERLQLRMQSPPRGLPIGEVSHSGELRTPPWDFLARSRYALLRHDRDPALDLLVPLSAPTLDNGRLNFTNERPDIVDFRRAQAVKDYSGPYLLPAPYDFEVEVHSGLNLPDPPGLSIVERGREPGHWATRRSLVPVHPEPEARGSDGSLYRPHPMEVALIGMEGPYPLHQSERRLLSRLTESWPSAGAPLATFSAALALVLMALGTIVGWSVRGDRGCRHPAWSRSPLGLPPALLGGDRTRAHHERRLAHDRDRVLAAPLAGAQPLATRTLVQGEDESTASALLSSYSCTAAGFSTPSPISTDRRNKLEASSKRPTSFARSSSKKRSRSRPSR